MRRISLAIVVSLLNSQCASPAAQKDMPEPLISGMVTNTQKKPLAGAQVILRDQDGRQLSVQTTDERGEFECKHEPCHSCTLQILPDLESRFACAIIDSVPGDLNRNFIVQLQHGFLVSGRVVHQNKGFKGVNIKVLAAAESAAPHKVHEGGWARTGRNGEFGVVLTPGRKKLLLLNEKYKELGERYQKEFDVTSEMQLPDITLP